MVVWSVKIFTVSLKCLLRVFFPEQENANGIWNGPFLTAAPARVQVELSCDSCGSVGRDNIWTSCSHLSCPSPGISKYHNAQDTHGSPRLEIYAWDICLIPNSRLLGLLYNVLASTKFHLQHHFCFKTTVGAPNLYEKLFLGGLCFKLVPEIQRYLLYCNTESCQFRVGSCCASFCAEIN